MVLEHEIEELLSDAVSVTSVSQGVWESPCSEFHQLRKVEIMLPLGAGSNVMRKYPSCNELLEHVAQLPGLS
ncbi:hypothetical protein XH84_22825 [Bradyrhizobium nanningense]|nr:hypothetical protein XH84_22825 [Bradyrhizobium nanningense]